MKEKQELLDDAEACKNKMAAASALIGGLAGERIRWTPQSKEFKAQTERLVSGVYRDYQVMTFQYKMVLLLLRQLAIHC